MVNPLTGITILDLSRLQSGPSCSQLLAYLGAYVIKVEDTNGGDITRINETSKNNSHFTIFNNSKESITLNLKTSQGKKILAQLIVKSDVILENYSYEVMEKLGFSWSKIKNINSQIIYASIKGYSEYSPYDKYKSFEASAQAISGLMSVNRDSNGMPKFVPIGIGDSGTGLHMAIGILAALRQRDKDGIGQKIEVSLYDSMINLMRIEMMKHLNPEETSDSHIDNPPTIFPCSPFGPDDYVVIHLVGEMLESVLVLINREDLLKYINHTDSYQHIHDEKIVSAITAWTKTKTKMEVFHQLAAAGIWCAPVMHPKEIVDDPYLVEKKLIAEVIDDVNGNYTTIGLPINFELNIPIVEKAPNYGEHTDKILKEILNLSENEISSLKDSGVVL